MPSWAHNSLPQGADASRRLESYKTLKGLVYRADQLHVSRFVKNTKPLSHEHLLRLTSMLLNMCLWVTVIFHLISMKTFWSCTFSICWWCIWGFASLNPMVYTGKDYTKITMSIDQPSIAFNIWGALQTPYERFSETFTPFFEDR